MTRFKKELMKKGFRLEETEPFMPTSDGFQAIVVNSEKCDLEYHHTSGSIIYHLTRSMELIIKSVIDN